MHACEHLLYSVFIYSPLIYIVILSIFYILFINTKMARMFDGNMGLINKVDMVCLSPVGYGV